MIKAISGFEWRYIVDRTTTPTSTNRIQIARTCSNCFEKHPLCDMSDGCQVCEPCSKDIEALTNRLPPTTERD